jgi:hypothetical protein
MAFETKALLKAIGAIIRALGEDASAEEIYNAVRDIANTEDVVLKPWKEKEKGE